MPFAIVGGIPKKIIIGNVINDPPPARVLITPENNPQINNMIITSVSIIFYFTRVHTFIQYLFISNF